MKRTLLDLTQSILSDIDGDEVNSIVDTFESEQVASILKESFLSMSSNRNWPLHKQALQIASYGDVTKPTHLRLPENIKELLYLNYNKARVTDTRLLYSPVTFLENDAFLRKTNKENTDATNVDIITDPSGVQLLIRNDTPPSHFTSFDDETIVFNSYDNLVEASIQESKTQAMAYMMPTWVHTDVAVIDLPGEAFSALLNEALSRASLRLRQSADQKAEQETTRQQRWLSRNNRHAKAVDIYSQVNYGRGSRKAQKDPTFTQGN
jgi:hypothetical protein